MTLLILLHLTLMLQKWWHSDHEHISSSISGTDAVRTVCATIIYEYAEHVIRQE